MYAKYPIDLVISKLHSVLIHDIFTMEYIFYQKKLLYNTYTVVIKIIKAIPYNILLYISYIVSLKSLTIVVDYKYLLMQ